MFERFTEKARRTIFFARYEASQYGSPTIETEHLLLGLLREDRRLGNLVLRSPQNVVSIRQEIEAQITVGKPISTSMEVPLSTECKRALHQAAEEADRLASKHIGTEHLLLGLLREEDGLAAKILAARGVDAAKLRVQFHEATGQSGAEAVRAKELHVARIASVLKPWAAGKAKEFAQQFHPEGQYSDVTGATASGPIGIEVLVDALFRTPGWHSKRWSIYDVQLVENIAVVSIFSGELAGTEPAPGEIRLILLFKEFAQGWLLLKAEAAVASSLPSEGST